MIIKEKTEQNNNSNSIHSCSFLDGINSTVLAEFSTFQTLIVSFWEFTLNIILVCITYKAFQNFDVKKQLFQNWCSLLNATVLSKKEISKENTIIFQSESNNFFLNFH